MELRPYQKDAVERLRSGCILYGEVGSGKSFTSLAYYFCKVCGGQIEPRYIRMKHPKDLGIITTGAARDKLEWQKELAPFLLSTDESLCEYDIKVVVDSWNNIKKYVGLEGAFVIFDEQRLVGSGAWVKAFYKIAKKNQWILLTATPGDTWSDYIPVFVANGFYKNKTEFLRQHAVFSRFTNYPKIDRYIEQGRLLRFRRQILVKMNYKRSTTLHNETVPCDYDKLMYKTIISKRWNFYDEQPIVNASERCYLERKVINTDESRQANLLSILESHPKAIIFYNFDYELEILKGLSYEKGTIVAEYNGHKHDKLPSSSRWVYLVQYTAGAEGWNCTTTDTIIFYSQNYSYRILKQSSGRIDRMNTPFSDLYYYHLRSRAPIDLAIYDCLKRKKSFQERAYAS